jgi:hypothetical protein
MRQARLFDEVVKQPQAIGGAAAGVNDGRVPDLVSAASVNCGTSSRPPCVSVTLRFILPASSANTR